MKKLLSNRRYIGKTTLNVDCSMRLKSARTTKTWMKPPIRPTARTPLKFNFCQWPWLRKGKLKLQIRNPTWLCSKCMSCSSR